MKAVIQRVKRAKVLVENKEIASINQGLVVLACVEKNDNEKVIDWFAKKIANLRIFSDEEGKFNLSIQDVKGEVLLVSNFTVCGYLRKGTRPSFHLAENPEVAEEMLKSLQKKLESMNIPVKTGKFKAYMEVEIVNDGPVTLFLSYPEK